MGKNQSASNLPNIIQYNNGSINFVSGSTLLMQISSSGAITTTGVISGSNALTASNAQTASSADQFTIRQNTTIGSNTSSLVVVNSLIGSDVLPDGDAVYNLGNNSGKQWNEVFANKYFGSLVGNADSATNSDKLDNLDSTSFVFTSSYNSDSSSVSTRVTKIEGNYATTGSNIFLGAQTVCANITSTGTIIAQTLNVQQVTSSVVYSSGSNVFGCLLTDRQQFTGSVLVTGSLTVTTAGTSPEFQVVTGGTIKGNALTDAHQVTGSLRMTGSIASFSNCVGIGITTPCQKLHVFGSSDSAKARFELLGTGGVNEVVQIVNSANWNPGRGVKMGLYVNSGSNQSQIGAEIGAITIASDALGADLFFNVATSGVATERMRITTAGNVGVGTCNPASKFTVVGGSCIPNSDNPANYTVTLQDPTSMAINVGGSLLFQGYKNGTAALGNFGYIAGRKENGTISDESGYLSFGNFNSGGVPSERLRIFSSGVSCFSSTVCAPSISMTGCIINTTDGGIFLKHSVNDKNFWVWQEFSNGWGQFTANCNTELNGLGGLFAGSGLATFFTNCGGGGGITLSSLTGAGNVCGVIGLNHSNGNAYFAGNIGMGANLSTNWATRSVLQLGTFGTSLSGYNGGGGATQLMHNIIANGFTYTYMNTGGATSQYMDGDSIVWANAAVCSAGTALTLIERMRITCGGNVGIGTSTPEGRLHIQGCTSGYGANLVLLNFCNATGASTGIDFGVDASSAGCGNGNAQIKVCNIGAGLGGNAADMTFHTWNGAAFGERFRISCNGNIFVAGGTLTNSANYKAHTFCLFDATSIPGKTFTVSGNTQGCFSVTDFTGIPTSARAVLVYGWYHINGDGLAGQADHAVSWFGVQNNTSLQTWSSPTQPWPGETTTFRCCNFGTFVMEHDGDASATGMSNGMNYYGSWHQGIIGVDSGGCIKYNLAHGYSSGTHYNGLYAAGYWL